MKKFEMTIFFIFIFYFHTGVISQITIDIGYDEIMPISSKGSYFYFESTEEQLSAGNILAFSTTPDEDFLKPGFIYASLEESIKSSLDYRNFSSQEMGQNILYINKNNLNENKNLHILIKSLTETNIRLKVSIINEIPFEENPLIRHKLKISDISNDLITFTKKNNINKKILFYALGENINYFDMKVKYNSKTFEVKQRYENGYGTIVDFTSEEFKDKENPKINIIIESRDESYKDRIIEIGYEIIDGNEDYLRNVEIMEHIYGLADAKETCYQFDLNKTENKSATMLINSFTPGVKFLIRDVNNSKVYSLDVFNNYFIRLPRLIFAEGNYFCFKHVTPKTSEEEIYGEVSYDFQIYYEDELNKYQMFIMPLINGKIYTHSLNRGDFMVYRHNSYNNKEGDKKILSANMLKIRGNPQLYGFTCNDYPNCEITKDTLKETIYPLNMYHINKRLNAEGNTKIENEPVSELKNQYLTIVSCESDEKDPNNGECKYTIEINNENDEIQLIPEIIFATSIISPENYFLIKLSDQANSIEYLKIDFTVFTGNAEMYIYTDKEYKNELKDYEFSHIHRKEIIEIKQNLTENYYIKITCAEPSFIQLKYETNEHYKGYENLMPNEVNFVPLNKNSNSYYNVYNPHYYYPFNDENKNKNNDFYYKVYTMDCFMGCSSEPGQISYGIKEYDINKEKNQLYSYLSSYGFAGRVQNFIYTSSEKESCGLIFYNGEKSQNTPLLINSDMPHKSTFIETYYTYPFIYDDNNDEGIIIDLRIYDSDDSQENDLYEITLGFYSGDQGIDSEYTISKNETIYLNKEFYKEIFNANILCKLEITLEKRYPDKKYYITTNIMSAKISPEYIYSNQDYEFYLRPSSSKYLYTQISKNSIGDIKLKNIPQNVEIYAKIVEKNKVEENYNWNKRVKLPEKDDQDLLIVENGNINYDIEQTSKCTKGCELYIHIKSSKILDQNIKITEKDLIFISFHLSQETNIIGPNYEENNIEISPIKSTKYILQTKEDLYNNKIIMLILTPSDINKPVFLYASAEDFSLNKRDFSSQKLGTNILILSTEHIKDGKKLYIYINSLVSTQADFKVELMSEINLKEYLRLSIKFKLEDISSDIITYTHSNAKTSKILFYALGENCNYFSMKVRYENENLEVKQRFENGYAALVDFSSDIFKDKQNPKVNIILEPTNEKYKGRIVDIGYEIIGGSEKHIRPVNIMEHVYGFNNQKDDVCYKITSYDENKKSIMLINTISPGLNFYVINPNNSSKVYSYDEFDNYFIRLPSSYLFQRYYFCFQHPTRKTSEQETYGEVSYDFQIYYEDELNKYQMFIMPLINGKIYTHSLNRGDIMIYRHNSYNYNEGDKKILSANMLRIRGNPKLYGYTCNDYPNCTVTKDNLANLEKISPLNMYHINKRLNAEGNTKIENEPVSELKNQYLTIVSCESDEKDPNNGECKYTIEINNENDEIQLIPEIIFATSIISPENYFLIKLSDQANSIEYLKIDFTVFTGNAEMYIYTDKEYKNELKDYEFSHIHRKEIIEIKNNFQENYYIIIKCTEPAFIKLKYETSNNYKGYDNIIPNEVNFEPLNQINKSFYNIYNPHYYYPFDKEENKIKNKDFYYQVIAMDCSMTCGHEPGKYSYNVNNYGIDQTKNVLYSYLSSYGFHGKVQNFERSHTEKDSCGLIFYNGEKSENTPLLINSDMPHKSTFEYSYYVYPFIYDENNDQGVIIDFKIYDVEDSNKKDLFKIAYGFEGYKRGEFSEQLMTYNTTIYKDKSFYHDICKDNILCSLYIGIKKNNPNNKYYITTNVISSKISPEYIYSNKTYEFKLRPSSSKYFYSFINYDSEGYIKFDTIPDDILLYAKIVENNKIDNNYNWNNRVKLPDEGDNDLLNINNKIIQYNKESTQKCNEGCELYFHIKSKNVNNNLKISENDLISISFTFKGEKYEEGTPKAPEGSGVSVWLIVVVIFAIVIIAFVITICILKKKRIYSYDIDQKDINDLSIPLE